MKVKTIFLALSMLYITGFSAISLADGYYSSQTADNGFSSTQTPPQNASGYSSTQTATRGSTYYSGYPAQQDQTFQFKSQHFSIGTSHHTVFLSDQIGPHWVDELNGYPLPAQAVLGGGENKPPRMLYVCRASYQGGLHPGKIVDGNCNIGWGGAEIRLPRYQVLVSNTHRYRWAPADGSFPPNTVDGGFDNGQRLYICQANWEGGLHPGKVYGANCNIGYGGKEISLPNYNILLAV